MCDPYESPDPIERRFWPYVDASGDCWEWTGGCNSLGYGQFHHSYDAVAKTSKKLFAHRYAYESLVGPIPADLVLDHLCRNPSCVNPDHLQPVTLSENNRRGFGWMARQRHQTICKHGHPFEGDNVGRHKDGTRYCRACSRERTRLRDEQYGNSPAKRAARRAA